ncbi:hypothetical protein M7I_7017 [Glarea lozoyensis 74030]|uniref:DUF6594 domain-containing protein n=1 Tax=Glarea lozoyensis (strain ATCC 74030 / MF5533) TaxID=1104152 RepID=H0EW57_GLAL7|nr:hypothetical protein M7I_7017 [Glarea lozoyensis 74030]
MPNLTPEEIEIKEWKYTGYQHYTRFIASDNDYLVFRRFSVLSTRVSLALQDEIVVLEHELAELDNRLSEKHAPDIHNGSFRADKADKVSPIASARAKLLHGKIFHKLKEYNEFMFHYSHLTNRPPVPTKDATSLSNWHENHLNAIQDEEAAYITHTEDLFSLVSNPKSPLRNLFEKSLHFRIFRPWQVKRKDPENAILSFATEAKPFETLGATAAYSAVLMVFLQIGK